MKHVHWMCGVVLCVSSMMAEAIDGSQVGLLTIEEPYARATAAGQSVGAGYFKMVNKGKTEDKLVSVTADVSASVELHTMVMEGDVAKMREVKEITLPAGQSVNLKPGGLHVMFLGLKAPLKEGSRFPATLKFEKAGEVKVDFQVRPVQAHMHRRH
ncbi:MAG: copper chaperone PCu(A)C [Burkholderiales bacterium]|jgi:copper(I)-binding protein